MLLSSKASSSSIFLAKVQTGCVLSLSIYSKRRRKNPKGRRRKGKREKENVDKSPSRTRTSVSPSIAETSFFFFFFSFFGPIFDDAVSPPFSSRIHRKRFFLLFFGRYLHQLGWSSFCSSFLLFLEWLLFCISMPFDQLCFPWNFLCLPMLSDGRSDAWRWDKSRTKSFAKIAVDGFIAVRQWRN